MTESDRIGGQGRPWLRSRLGPRSKKVLLIAGGMLVALLIVEIGLRISGVEKVEITYRALGRLKVIWVRIL